MSNTTAITDAFSPQYVDLLGSRFQIGGRGPDVFDCYGLVMEIYRRQGIVIPDVISPSHADLQEQLVMENHKLWTPVEIQPGAVITFRIGRHVSHVGVAVNETDFVHIWAGGNIGVAKEKIDFWRKRIHSVLRYSGYDNNQVR